MQLHLLQSASASAERQSAPSRAENVDRILKCYHGLFDVGCLTNQLDFSSVIILGMFYHILESHWIVNLATPPAKKEEATVSIQSLDKDPLYSMHINQSNTINESTSMLKWMTFVFLFTIFNSYLLLFDIMPNFVTFLQTFFSISLKMDSGGLKILLIIVCWNFCWSNKGITLLSFFDAL